MALHVDVVKNEWLAGVQHVVARLFEEAGQVHLDSPDPDVWQSIVLRPLTNRETGDIIYPEKEPDEFLRLLRENLRGDYLFATGIHDENECPFVEHSMIPIDP
jgi:hypothetical protein